MDGPFQIYIRGNFSTGIQKMNAFGIYDDFIPSVFEGISYELLTDTVHTRGIVKIDACLQCPVQNPDGFRFMGHRLPCIGHSYTHATKGNFRDFHPRTTQNSLFHFYFVSKYPPDDLSCTGSPNEDLICLQYCDSPATSAPTLTNLYPMVFSSSRLAGFPTVPANLACL